MKTPVSTEYVCRDFDRVPDSLIEEPEVCEFCSYYDNGYCTKEADYAQS